MDNKADEERALLLREELERYVETLKKEYSPEKIILFDSMRKFNKSAKFCVSVGKRQNLGQCSSGV